jgi:hypothetical protein
VIPRRTASGCLKGGGLRSARKKLKGKDCYLFNDVAKEMGMRIVLELRQLFLIESIPQKSLKNIKM